MIQELHIKSPELRTNPYPIYARLRSDSPVAILHRPLMGKAFILSRYEDVNRAFTDPRLANNRRNATNAPDPMDRWFVPALFKAFGNNLLATDAPDHRRLRDLVHKAFTPRRVEDLKGLVERIVTDLLDAALKKPSVNLIADFALPLPLTVISVMMGVPEEERLDFHHWTASLLEGVTSATGMFSQFPNAFRMERFFRKLIRLRREQPGDDLLTALVQAEEKGDRMSENELISMIFLLLLAGHETTVNLIGNGTLALLQHPEQFQRLHREPDLIGSAVEELLRFTNPVVQPSDRYAREDITLHGTVIPKGSVVLPLVASANRDEQAFSGADQLDLGRTPNRHLAFGMGVHYCLGAPLARLEGKIALQALVQRFPRMKLALPEQRLEWRGTVGLRGLKQLPVQLS
ncbi:MAG: cytochrome P450 [Cystobacter sp.]